LRLQLDRRRVYCDATGPRPRGRARRPALPYRRLEARGRRILARTPGSMGRGRLAAAIGNVYGPRMVVGPSRRGRVVAMLPGSPGLRPGAANLGDGLQTRATSMPATWARATWPRAGRTRRLPTSAPERTRRALQACRRVAGLALEAEPARNGLVELQRRVLDPHAPSASSLRPEEPLEEACA